MSNEALSNLLHEERTFPPSEEFAAAAVAKADLYDEAAKDRLGFWEQQADRLQWESRWDDVLDWRPPFAKWFVGGTLNVAVNCVDRHVAAGNGDRVALHWEGEPGDTRTLTYAELKDQVSQAANALTALGVAGRRPGRDLPADDPRGDGGDARLRPHRRPALGRLRRLLGRGARLPHRRRQHQGGHHRGRRLPAGRTERAEAGRRRGARRSPRARPSRRSLVVRRTEQDVAWTDDRDVWWHDALGRREHRARAAGVRLRAPAVHPLHVRHHREAEGHPAHLRRLPHPDRRTRSRTSSTTSRRPTSTGARPTSAGSPGTATSSTGRCRTARPR